MSHRASEVRPAPGREKVHYSLWIDNPLSLEEPVGIGLQCAPFIASNELAPPILGGLGIVPRPRIQQRKLRRHQL